MAEQNQSNKPTIKDHLYVAYLTIGIIAFSLGAYISYKRIKNGD